MSDTSPIDRDDAPPIRWFLRGVRTALSAPGLILATAFVGFGSLAREAGITLIEASFMTLAIWALPAIIVLVGAIQSGATLLTAAFAVTLSSVRFLPMLVALVPELRGPHTRRWVLYALSHFVAITSWVLAFQHLPHVPRERRTAFYAGLAGWLLVMNLGVVAVTYVAAPSLPPIVTAALLMLTPMYFLTSLWSAARDAAGKYALVLGIVLGPLCHLVAPAFDLVIAGVVGGCLAYALQRATSASNP
jgi:predicted branched-subunit amino acid permease